MDEETVKNSLKTEAESAGDGVAAASTTEVDPTETSSPETAAVDGDAEFVDSVETHDQDEPIAKKSLNEELEKATALDKVESKPLPDGGDSKVEPDEKEEVANVITVTKPLDDEEALDHQKPVSVESSEAKNDAINKLDDLKSDVNNKLDDTKSNVDENDDPKSDSATTNEKEPETSARETASSPPVLPPRNNQKSDSPPPLPPRKRAPFFWLRGSARSPSGSASSIHLAQTAGSNGASRRSFSMSSPDYDLVLSRLDANSETLKKQDSASKDASLTGIKELQTSFEVYKKGHALDDQDASSAGIDWETWTSVVNDYASFARNKPEELSRAIASGFPAELRGLIWQLIASSKTSTLQEVYVSIQDEPSPHDKAIKRDLSRTSFIQDSSQMDALYRVIRAYSLFDPDVGYTQGMAFITVPLLMNMAEGEAFSLLVHLMKDYGLRQMFLPDMPGLHIRLYQFDRLLEDTLPDVHIHLARQGVRSSMYASQWFLTMFAYKFPLEMVLRILDIVIAEGLESLLRFAVALMKRNASAILELEFDAVLPFLKENIFDYYVVDTFGDGEPQYSVGELVGDAFDIKVLPVTLRKYENEYQEIHRVEQERVEEVESLRSSNGQLTLQVRRLETSLATLNQEHIQVANEMVQGKMEVARLQDENEEMSSELAELREANKDGVGLADKELREEMEKIKQENSELVETKTRLEGQLGSLEQELVDTKMKLATLNDSHSNLTTRWNDLKKHIEGI